MGVMEVRVRVGIVDNAISGFGRGVRRQEFSCYGEIEHDRSLWEIVSAQRS